MEKGSVRKIVALVFRALTLAMGVAVVAEGVLSLCVALCAVKSVKPADFRAKE